jgi:enoyl-CoA hydratase
MSGSVAAEGAGAGIVVLRFDNPPHAFLDAAMTGMLESLVARLADDEEVRVVVLTGAAPGSFIRHFDLAELSVAAEARVAVGNPVSADWRESPFHRITRTIETMAKPVIAAIDGPCMGVGLEIALACDIRIAGKGDYPIGLPEMNIGMFPGGGGTVRLGRLIGMSRAMALICAADTVGPEQALALGLVESVEDDPLDAALVLAHRIAALAPTGVAEAKRLIRASVDVPIEAALTLEQQAVDRRLGTEEVRGLLSAIVETGRDLRDPPR